MLHIIVLNKGYFPEKLNGSDTTKDKVIVVATPTDSIPVSAYQNDMLKNMEIKILPALGDEASLEDKNILRISQAMLIGQLSATEKEYEVYSDDEELLKALAPFTGKKIAAKKSAKKAAPKKAAVKEDKKHVEESLSDKKEDQAVKEKAPSKNPEGKKDDSAPSSISKKRPMVSKNVLSAENSTKEEAIPKKETAKAKESVKKEAKKALKKTAVKLPTQAQVKKVLGAANSGYTKAVMDVIKSSSQITFEMNMRMKLAEAGLSGTTCQELAKTLNDEFGKSLPTA